MGQRQALVILAGMGVVVCAIGLACFLPTSRASGAEGTSLTEEASPPRLALLVGVESYPKLGPTRQLDGCRNDVRVFRGLLVDRFGFRHDDVVALLDSQATGESIRSEMGRLVQRVAALPPDRPAAQVVFYFSGHGSQVRDQEVGHDDCDEEDGLDETLVPYDAQMEGGDQDIRDDELYRFVEAVAAGGRARVWIVLDCCHSGTGVRGVTKIRRLDRHVIPSRPKSSEGRKITPKRLPEAAVLLSACRACEVEPEYREGKQSYGLLTRFLAQVLEESPQVSALSYRMLREMILDCYRRNGVVPAPIPQLEGAPEAVRSTVLGAGSRADRKPYFKVEPLSRDRRTVRMRAGAFHGVTVGSLYELYERPDQIVWHPNDARDDAQPPSLAWLEISEVDGVQATAQVFQWTDARQSDKIEIGLPRTFTHGYAIERYHQHPHFGARIRVVRAIDASADGLPLGPSDPDVPPAVRHALTSIREAGESPWLRWVEKDEPCDLLLRIDGRYAALFPATGMAATAAGPSAVRGQPVPASLRGGWGPIDLGRARRGSPDPAAAELKDYLRRIVRARNLIRVAATRSATGNAARVQLQLLDVKLNRDLEIESQRPWPIGTEPSLTMRKDDLFALRVVSREMSGKPLYVTVLAIDPDMQIQVVLPQQEGIGLADQQRLEPGTARVSSPYRCTEPYGPHWAIALATDRPHDFTMLAQPALPRTRSIGSDSPLDALLWEQTYFRTRGSRRPRPQKSNDRSWSAAILSWHASP